MPTRKLNGPLGGDYQTDGVGNAVPLNAYPLDEDDDVPARLADHEARVTAQEAQGAVLIAAGSANEAPAINALLAAAIPSGQSVRTVTLVGDFTISNTLVVHSDTILDLTRASLTLNPSAGGNLIQSQAAFGSGRDTNITILGGAIDRGANTGITGLDNMSVIMRKVDGLTIRGMSCTSSAGKYAILIQNCTNFTVERITFSTASDGVHIQGPAANGTVRDLFGTTGDDMFAITPKDYPAYQWGDEGDVHDILVDGIYPTATLGNAVKVVGGSGVLCYNIVVRNIQGTVASPGYGVWIGDDSADAALVGGSITDVTMQNLSLKDGSSGYAFVHINGSNIGTVTLDNVVCKTNSSTLAVRLVNGSVVDHLVLRNLVTTGVQALAMSGNANASRVDISGLDGTNQALINLTGTSQIGTLNVDGVRLTGSGASAALLALASGTVVGTALFRGVAVSTTAATSGPFQIAGTATDLTVIGATFTFGVACPFLVIIGSTGSVSRFSLSNFKITFFSASNALLRADTNGATLSRCELANGNIASPAAWILDTAVATALVMSGIKCTGNIANVRATGNITVDAVGCDLKTGSGTLAITAGGVARVRSGMPCDVSLLTGTAGDQAWNTNASLGCGTGPVISNGTLWKHLYSGSTT